MTPADIIARLEAKFDTRITGKNVEAIDPFVSVDPAALLDVARFLRDVLHLEILNCISGVDYLETDPKKVAKAGFEPHLEVVYHLSSFTHKHRFVLKLSLPRWKDDKPGQLPEVPSIARIWRAADWHERDVDDLSGVLFTEQ